MISDSQRIRALAERGTISASEEARLLASVGAPGATPNGFLDPFHKFGGFAAAAAGLVLAVLSIFVSRAGVRFDGALDLHLATSSLRTAFAEQVIAWPLTALVFWTLARALRSKGRFVDFLGMVGLARLPVVLVALPLTWFVLPSGALKSGIATLGLALLALTAVTWHVTWLYQGFKNASGFRDRKVVASFAVGIVIAEVVSKIAVARAVF